MMNFGSLLSSIAVGALILFVIYRRFRRTFGRQRLSQGRMIFRIVLLSLVGVLYLTRGLLSWQLLGVQLLGLAAGVGLAIWGASQTTFERKDGVLYYVPHTLSGIVVSVLFLCRLAYRLLSSRGSAAATGAPAPPPDVSMAAALSSPLTLGLLFVLIGYYACYYSMVLFKSRAERIGIAGSAGAPASGETSKPG